MLLYYSWWIHFIYWFTSGAAEYPNSCGAANAGMIMITLVIIFIYSIVLLYLILKNEQQKQKDYIKFIISVYVPIVLLILYFLIR